MRWIFLTLVLVNLLIYSAQWMPQYVGSELQENFSLAKGAKPLSLLSGSLNGKLISDAVQNKAQKSCLLIGPLSDSGQADLIKTALSEVNIHPGLVRQVVEKAPKYWVYDGPFQSRSEALARLRLFQKRKIDSFLITRGKLKNSISVGIFENIDLARGMRDVMAKKGYKTKIEEISRHETEIWLSFADGYAIESNKKIKDVLSQFEVVPEMRQILCKGIASP